MFRTTRSFAAALVSATVFATPSGVVQFSFSPDTPFTDTLEVTIQLDETGSGLSSIFTVKGASPGVTSVQACSAIPTLGCILTPFDVTVMGIADVNFRS